jgi:hypothetical protein
LTRRRNWKRSPRRRGRTFAERKPRVTVQRVVGGTCGGCCASGGVSITPRGGAVTRTVSGALNWLEAVACTALTR